MSQTRLRRNRKRERRTQLQQRPWCQPRNRYTPLNLLSVDQIETLHHQSLRILRDIGVRFHSPAAVDYFRAGGAALDADGITVRLDEALVQSALSTVTRQTRLTPRNTDHAVTIGADYLAFATVLGPPNCSDLEQGHRPGTLEDFANFIRLAQYFNVIHLLAGSPVEPLDVPVNLRHLESTRTMLKLSDKVPYVFCHSRERVLDVLEMIAIAQGLSLDELTDNPVTYSIINTNSPLQYDRAMADGLIELARFGQLPLITPFSVAGASMPISIAGASALANAEMLAGLVLTQLVRPGAPVVTGAKTVPVDMGTGSLADASPESNKALQIGAQLARYYDLPYRAACFTNSNAPDAQAGYESQSQLWAAVTSGTHLLMHAAGWLETGLCASFEKFVLDVDMLQAMTVYLEPIEVNETTLAFEEIADVGPGGHYFATEQTIANYETAFHRPLVFEGKNYEQWVEEGSPDAAQRAHSVYKQALADYQQPTMEPGRMEALNEFVAKRTAQGGAPLD